MKVGVVTITQAMNYGQRLQNYAVEQILKSIGISCETILLEPNYPLTLKQRTVLAINAILKRGEWKTGLRPLKFDTFNKKYLHFSKESFASGNFDDFDYIVCGSDQIWNLSVQAIRDNLDYYFASFVEPNKRISFSASIGIDKLDDAQAEILSERVRAMKSVSVREKTAEKLIRDVAGREVITTVDPVLILDETAWMRVAKRPNFIHRNEQFILTYFLGRIPEQTQQYFENVSRQTGMRIVRLQGDVLESGNDYRFFSADPAEFIWLIANSALVFTDSFHGCAFSCIFQKPFRWFSRSDGGSMNSRLDNLFSLFSLDGWAVGNLEESIDTLRHCDYTDFLRVIASEQKKALDYLKENLC